MKMSTKSSSLGQQCEHNALIRRQFIKIEALENELALLRLERDALAGDNERLQFQLECLNNSSSSHASCAHEEKESHEKREVELSQHLLDKRVDALERKYGGIVARESAVCIQKAFRKYRLQKRFQSIAKQVLKTQSETTLQNHETRSDESQDSQQSLINEAFVASVSSNSCLQECERKRRYRVGLNLLNKKAEKGIQFLTRNGFLDSNCVESVARFLLTRKGVSKAVIGDYLSEKTSHELLLAFVSELDFSSLPLDSSLRKFQTFFRFPGEAQKIERLVDAFATRYLQCNPDLGVSRDSLFILSFAIIMLNTDLHSPTNQRNRMSSQQWLHNLSHVFNSQQFSQHFLLEIYERIKSQELRTGADHVTQVMKVQQALVSNNRALVVPNLCVEWRRLVCYCRLYEMRDKRDSSRDRHQREVFLFNDLLLVTKLSARAKNQMPEYVFRQSFPLEGLHVDLFETMSHRFGIEITRKLDEKRLIVFNARNSLDQKRFSEDLRESISETDEMENQRITKTSSLLHLNHETNNTRDTNHDKHLSSSSSSEQRENVRRKSSSGSLDSGLSLPSRDHSPQTQNQKTTK